jgi:hypothetical protein
MEFMIFEHPFNKQFIYSHLLMKKENLVLL